MSKKIMSAHQPNFLPYLGFFDKMMQSEVFVIRDECQFSEKEYHHRNKIRIDGKCKDGKDIGGPNWKWLTVPIPHHEIDLKDIHIKNEKVENNKPWNAEMARIIKINYEKAPFFEQYFPGLEKALLTRREMLVDLSMDVIYCLKEAFGLKAEIVMASKLPGYQKSGNPVQDLANLSKIVEANVYLSGAGGKDYFKKYPVAAGLFEKDGIEVRFQDYQHPTYPQRYLGFAPYLAAIDALFNVGPEILKAGSKKEDKKEESKRELQMQQA
ncbi:MAG: WbqC family protein [Nanoarchaeota archaeon]|nr:WbqC family protein [Nanoarchaeota archaeon]